MVKLLSKFFHSPFIATPFTSMAMLPLLLPLLLYTFTAITQKV